MKMLRLKPVCNSFNEGGNFYLFVCTKFRWIEPEVKKKKVTFPAIM
jgi:hypothetical protein